MKYKVDAIFICVCVSGEKPYRCPLDGCDKAFAQMSNLQHHMRQHDKATFGQKQCMCPFCDRGYASEKSLKSHLSKVSSDLACLYFKKKNSENCDQCGICVVSSVIVGHKKI